MSRFTTYLRRFASFAFAPPQVAFALCCASSPAMAASQRVDLPAGSPFPESVSASSDGTLYVSSISSGGIVKVAPDRQTIAPFIKPGALGTAATFGVNADEAHGLLWVCSNQIKEARLPGDGIEEGAFLKAFDLKDGSTKGSYKLPGGAAMCNDTAVAADGTVYVTNTLAPQILRLKPGASQLEVWLTDESLKGGLDGIALGKDGNLYVNTYLSGELFRIGISEGAPHGVTRLATSRPLTHPDGLRPIGEDFVMVEGAGPLDRVTINGNMAKIDTIATFAGPTGVTQAGDRLWIAEGQIALLGSPADKLPAFQLQSVELGPLPGSEVNGGISLPPGFKATVFADHIGHARHMAAGPDGVLYVNSWSGVYYKNDKPPAGGFLIALKDGTGAGAATIVKRIGPDQKAGSHGGTGIAVYDGKLYYEINDRIERYALPADGFSFRGKAEVVLSGLPVTGDHPMHPILIGKDGALYVDLGSATNSCQPKNRMTAIPGTDPCIELQTRGGIWKYDANKLGQVFSPKERYATGLRNGEGLAFDDAGRLFATQHGRDQLSGNWDKLYTARQSAELPAEEIVQLDQGADFGWPYCYYDQSQGKLVLAPEFGGDGGHATGRCTDKKAPVAAFPAHWAPNGMALYRGSLFPKAYQGGLFVAFHGSWNRSPLPQGGYNLVFQPMADGKPSGDYVVFADGFAGANKEPGRAAHRPSGVAVGQDGALYVSDDQNGRIWRITYQGDAGTAVAAAPPVNAIAVSAESGVPPEGTHPDAGLAGPPGTTPAQLARGKAIFAGEAADGTCAGCHGGDGSGGPIGPDLRSGKWLWGNGSLAAIKHTILEGVPTPKEHPGAMPPKGGGELAAPDVDALAAYVWAISRGKK